MLPRRFLVSSFTAFCTFGFEYCCLDLESEMYQLSHLLSEQKSLLNSLSTTSVLGDETPIITEIDKSKQGEDEDEVKQKIAEILERVEGCTVSSFYKIREPLQICIMIGYFGCAWKSTTTRR